MFIFFRRFRALLRPYRGRLLLGAVLVLVGAAADVALPWPVKIAVDGVVRPTRHTVPHLPWHLGHGERLLVAAVGLLAVLAVVSAFVSHVTVRLLDGTGERLGADLRAAVFAHLQELDVGFHERSRTGDVVTRATADVDYVQDMLVTFLGVLVPNLAVVVAIAAVCLWVSLGFGALAVSVAPVMLVAVSWFKRRIKAAARVARGKEGALASQLTETFQAVRVMQVFTAEGQHRGRFNASNGERLAAGLRTVRLQAALAPTVDLLSAAGTALVLFFGVHEVLAGRMTLGMLLVFLAYLNSLYDPVRKVAKATAVISRGVASAERLSQLLDEQPAITDACGATEAPRFAGRIVLDGVRFAYPTDGKQVKVLRGVDLVIEPGQTVGLVGSTGSGKTTIASLIPRLLDVGAGAVTIDGVDVRSMTVASLRAQISVVPQEPTLFAGTIRDNIAYGRPDAGSDAIGAAARAANVTEFADRLPAGLDTPVSEAGLSLSGGQRQRVAIARALLRDAPIVILDEPTAGLDPVSESLVMDGIKRLSSGRTVLVIAHRIHTLIDADAIHVMDGGRIIESGTHHQLLDQGGRYAALVGAASAFQPPRTVSSLPPKRTVVPATTTSIRLTAAAVVYRGGRHGPEVLLVHRRCEQDWGLPKGHVKDCETITEALLREVAEEAGVAVTAHGEIARSVHLDARGRRRQVHYLFASTAGAQPRAEITDNDEIDDVAWERLDRAVLAVDNPRERTVLIRAGSLLEAENSAVGTRHGPNPLLLLRAAQSDLHDDQPGAYDAPICSQGHMELSSVSPIVQSVGSVTVSTTPWPRAIHSAALAAPDRRAAASVHTQAEFVEAAVNHHCGSSLAPALFCADEQTILRALIGLRSSGVTLDRDPRARHASLWIIGKRRATYFAPVMPTRHLRTAAPAAFDTAETRSVVPELDAVCAVTIETLSRLFPREHPAVIACCVEECSRRFAGARITSYIPVLLYKLAYESLVAGGSTGMAGR